MSRANAQLLGFRSFARKSVTPGEVGVDAGEGVLLAIDQSGGRIRMQEIERLHKRIAELESLSTTDVLTGAWNRAQLDRMVHVEISRAERFGQSVSLILLDIDHFKTVNDVHGHLTGDAVLKEFVGRIRDRMRDIDALFRWGGDEFVVLAPSVGYQGGAILAERLRKAIAAAAFANVGPLTASLGVTEHLEGESVESWFQRSDQALYAAKAAGRNRVEVERRGRADLVAQPTGTGLPRLHWQKAYQCGVPAIDADHRELFDLGNALIAAAIEARSRAEPWRAALDSMLAHLVQHFREEEALLGERCYPGLAEHQRAHAALLGRANALRAAVEHGEAPLAHLVDFIVNDVIALHLFKVDTDFYALLRDESSESAGCRRS